MNKTLGLSICMLMFGVGVLCPSDAATPSNSSSSNLISSNLTSSNPTPVDPKVMHAIDRLSFGARPGDVERVETLGVEGYINQQLHPESIPEPQSLTDELSQLETLKLTPLQLFDQITPSKSPTPDQRRAYRQQMAHVLEQADQARLLNATENPRQLQEVMVDFWYNHFNVFDRKGIDTMLVGSYEQQAIRPYALGRFRDLLEATARHPAMLYYLDNWQNSASSSMNPGKRAQGLNENYARELMELHTLGVDSGYTQQDVIALAKILTGWTFRRTAQPGVEPNGFYFDTKRHDFSDKVFLGHTIKGSGMAEVEQALDILAKSPATAHHISYQLAQYFVSDQPPKALVDRLTQTFLSTDGDIRSVLSTLFHSSEFWDSKTYHAKFKTPYQYAVSAIRASGAKLDNFRPVQGVLQQLGMPLYGCLTPDGYKNTEDAWLNPDALTRRINFATTLASGRFTASQPIDSAELANTLGHSFSTNTEQTIEQSPPNLRAALILGSPEFMRR